MTKKPSDELTFSEHENNEYLHVEVTDNGSGIEHNILDRIFEPFFTTKDVDKGTGLGLSVVHGIIKSHHGEINVQSEKGKGTTFDLYFILPLKNEISKKDDSQKIIEGSESILLIDDEVEVCNVTKRQLEVYGYSVDMFINSEEALSSFKLKNYDLVITDLTMPQMSGINFAEEIKKQQSNTPIIIFTGYSDDKLSNANTEELNIKEVLNKPVPKRELIQTVQNILNKEKNK